MKNCYIYARTAMITQQRLKRNRSIAITKQINACKDYAENHNFQVLQIFDDEGSGNKINKGLQNLLAHCKTFPPDAVIVNSIDRLSRNFVVNTQIRKELEAKGIKLLSVSQGDMSSNNFIGNIYAAMAQWEYESKQSIKK